MQPVRNSRRQKLFKNICCLLLPLIIALVTGLLPLVYKAKNTLSYNDCELWLTITTREIFNKKLGAWKNSGKACLSSVLPCGWPQSLAPALTFPLTRSPHRLEKTSRAVRRIALPKCLSFLQEGAIQQQQEAATFIYFNSREKSTGINEGHIIVSDLSVAVSAVQSRPNPICRGVFSVRQRRAIQTAVPGHLPAWQPSSDKHIVQSIYSLLTSKSLENN